MNNQKPQEEKVTPRYDPLTGEHWLETWFDDISTIVLIIIAFGTILTPFILVILMAL